MFDFPPGSLVGEKYTDAASGKVYVWNGYGWLAEGTNKFVLRSGDTMLGFLTLHAHPLDPFHAATKQYVDNLMPLFGTFVLRGGDTMLGFLTLHAHPTLPMHAATKQYVDGKVPAPLDAYTKAESDANFVNIPGDTMTGQLNLPSLGLTTGGLITGGTYVSITSGAASSHVGSDGNNFYRNTAHSFQPQNASTTWLSVNAASTTVNGTLNVSNTAGNIHINLCDGAAGNAIKSYYYWDRSSGEAKIRNLDSQGEFILASNGFARCAAGVGCKVGLGGGYTGNAFNIEWNSGSHLWIDNTDHGVISVSSDYRIKKDVADLGSTWDVVKALRPISYTQAEYTPQIEIEYQSREAERRAKQGLPAEAPQPMFAADDIERWGFVAHELQETLVPSAANGVKDDPAQIQSPNPMTVIAALTKALQEAMQRIEALEAKVT